MRLHLFLFLAADFCGGAAAGESIGISNTPLELVMPFSSHRVFLGLVNALVSLFDFLYCHRSGLWWCGCWIEWHWDAVVLSSCLLRGCLAFTLPDGRNVGLGCAGLAMGSVTRLDSFAILSSVN